MCGEGLFSVGLGSCGRGIEKTATSGLVSVCACAVRDFLAWDWVLVGVGLKKRRLPIWFLSAHAR